MNTRIDPWLAATLGREAAQEDTRVSIEDFDAMFGEEAPQDERVSIDEFMKLLDEPEPSAPAENRVHSQMWKGKKFYPAREEWRELRESEDVEKAPWWNPFEPDIYVDPETGEREILPAPEPVGMIGGLLIDGVKAPFTDGTLAEAWHDNVTNPDAGLSIGTKFNQGVRESLGAVLELGAAGVDHVAGTELGEYLRRNNVTADFDTSESTADSLIADGVPALVVALSGGGSAMAARSAALSIRQLPTFLKNAAKFLGAEAAAASTVSTNEGTLFWGDVDMDSADAGDIINHRLQTMAEGIAMGSTAAGVTWAGRQVYRVTLGGIVSAIANATSKGKLEEDLFFQLANELTGLPPEAPEKAQREVIQRIAEGVYQNKDVFVRRLDDLDTVDQITLDTITAIQRGIDPKDLVSRGRIQEAGQGVSQKARGHQFRAAQSLPAQHLDGQLQSASQSFGGETVDDQLGTMTSAADAVAQTGRREFAELDRGVAQAQDEFNRQSADLLSAMRDNPLVGDMFKRLEKVTGTEIPVAKAGKLDEVQSSIRQGYESMTAKKNELYGAIKGGDVDAEAVMEKFQHLPIDTLLEGPAYVRSSGPVRNFLKAIKDSHELAEETGDDPLIFFAQMLEGNGATFEWFQKELKPELSRMATTMKKQSMDAQVPVVRDLIKFIDDGMLDHVAKTSPETADAAREALKYYREDYAPIWRDGMGEDYSMIYDDTLGRSSREIEGHEFKPKTFAAKSDDLVRGTLEGGSVPRTRDIAQMVQTAGNPADVADYMILDVVDSFGSEVSAKGLDNVDVSVFSSRLQRYAESLNSVAPEKADEINQFLSILQSQTANKAQREQALKEIVDQTADRKKEILNKVLKPFLQDGDIGLSTTDGEQAFRAVFKDKEALGKIRTLKERLGTLPAGEQEVALRGMKTAYTRLLRDKLITRSTEMGGGKPVSIRNISRAEDGSSGLFELGEEIFADTPEIMQAIRHMATISEAAAEAKNAKPNASFSPTQYLKSVQDETGTLLNMVFGPLNHTATKIRTVVNRKVQTLQTKELAASISDRILADPDYFLELVGKYNKEPTNPKVIDEVARHLVATTFVRTEMADSTPGEADRGILGEPLARGRDAVSQTREMLGGTP